MPKHNQWRWRHSTTRAVIWLGAVWTLMVAFLAALAAVTVFVWSHVWHLILGR